MSSSRGPSPTAHERRDVVLLAFGDAEQPRQAERRADALLDEVAEVDAAQPLDEVGEHPVRRGRVVLEARARLPLQLPLARTARGAAPASAPSTAGITAFGKPAVCSITCSTVTASLPLAANSGTYSATGRVHVEQAVADQQPHRRRHDRLRAREDAVTGCRWSRRRTSRTPRARRRGRPRAGTTAASRSPHRRRARSSSSRMVLTRGEIRLRPLTRGERR